MLSILKKTAAAVCLFAMTAAAGNYGYVKNIIVLIPDGCGTSHQTIARWFKGAPLVQDELTPGICKTNSANSIITGSAAASTAFATGYKTWEQDGAVKCLGILPDSVVFPVPERFPAQMQWRPVASVLEAARLRGMATGLIATSRISHATPAGYSCHWHDRDNDNVIMEQQVYENIDVVFGGGMRHLLPLSVAGGKRTDGENLVGVLNSRGYSVISTRDELLTLPSSVDRVWGLFNLSHMQADINRQYFGRQEPSLSEMTEKALTILSRNPYGFFLMVEGSQVDWASHNNDAVGTVTEYMAFDAAVQVAVDFAKRDGSTMVLVFPDHDNGGMSLGRRGDTYTDIQTEEVIDALKKPTITCIGLLDTLIRSKKTIVVDSVFVAQALLSFMGVEGIGTDDANDIKTIVASVAAGTMNDADVANIARIIDRRADMAWTTYGHTGNDVWIYGLGVEFEKTLDNTDIAEICFRKLGVNKEMIGRILFQDVNELFRHVKNAVISMDTTGAAAGKGSVSVSTPGKTATFPFYKNEMYVDGKTIEMNGLTVYSQKANRVFVPMLALKLFIKK